MARSRRKKQSWIRPMTGKEIGGAVAQVGLRAGGIVVGAVVTNKVVSMLNFIPTGFRAIGATIFGLAIEVLFANPHLCSFGQGMTDYGLVTLANETLAGNRMAQKMGVVSSSALPSRSGMSGLGAADYDTDQLLLEELADLEDSGDIAESMAAAGLSGVNASAAAQFATVN